MPESLKLENGAVISMRPVVISEDEPFLKKLFFSTIEEMAAMWGLPGEQRDGFMEMQYRAQKMQYDSQYPDAADEIVLLDGNPVGRVLVDCGDEVLLLVDVAVLSEQRGRGIGELALKRLISEAESSGKRLRLHVNRTNPAVRLYERLGMQVVNEGPIHFEMELQTENG